MWHFTDQYYHVDLDRIEMVSAGELANVGNCALSTSLILAAGDKPAYARAAITEMAAIAERRIKAEGELSKAVIAANPDSAALQTTIITAWRDYYLGAIAKIPEMTLPHLDLTSELSAAEARVSKVAAEVLASLGPN